MDQVRKLILQQDEEYKLSLENDRKKEILKKQKEDEDKFIQENYRPSRESRAAIYQNLIRNKKIQENQPEISTTTVERPPIITTITSSVITSTSAITSTSTNDNNEKPKIDPEKSVHNSKPNSRPQKVEFGKFERGKRYNKEEKKNKDNTSTSSPTTTTTASSEKKSKTIS
jgi:hypothetical protein